MLELAPPGAHLALELVGLRQHIDRLELTFSQRAAAFDKTDFWDEEGSNSAIDWIRFNCKMTSNAAADRIAVGERLEDMAESCKAMEAGEIGFAHMTVMARTANAVGNVFDETKLLSPARESSPGKFHYKCMHYRHSVNAKAYADCSSVESSTQSVAPQCAQRSSLWLASQAIEMSATRQSATPTHSSS